MSNFTCGDADLDEFLQKDAARLRETFITRVYLARYEGELAGYVALLADAIELKINERKNLVWPSMTRR